MELKRLIAKGLRAVLQPPSFTNCKIDAKARVCSGSHINHSRIDKYSYVGHGAFMVNAAIGPFCSIADGCRIGGASHALSFVSTSPVFCEGKNVMNTNFSSFASPKTEPVAVGADVWIGANAIVLSGVSIGVGAVVGAGSVVTKDVPPYAIVVGNPAVVKKHRFPDSVITELLESRWWECDDETLRLYAAHFDSPSSFLDELRGHC